MKCKACDKLLSTHTKYDMCAVCRDISVQSLQELYHEDYAFTEYHGRILISPPHGDILEEIFTNNLRRG